jgi:hypothetical protein
MTVFEKALESYNNHHNLYRTNNTRIEQLTKLTKILNEHFPFDTINCIETGGSQSWLDGMVGYYFAHLSHNTGGKFISVDINPDHEDKVYKAYSDLDPNIEITHITDDSLNLLKNPPYIPNLVHLDSWDVNLKDPLPSALHGWREFEIIESQMPVGSIIIIDDNWYQGSWVEWYTSNGNGGLNKEIIDINYPCLGKGAHIYQWVTPGDKNWKILDAEYKLVIQKEWQNVLK